MNFHVLFGVAAATLVLGVALPAVAAQNVKVGALRCEVSAGLGLIVTSSEELSCAFTSPRGRREHYYGRIRKFGLDIGATDRGVIAWDVFAAIEGPLPRGDQGENPATIRMRTPMWADRREKLWEPARLRHYRGLDNRRWM